MIVGPRRFSIVAPYVGAWIETELWSVSLSCSLSHPTWVRGLKHARHNNTLKSEVVAPYVGAWIETDNPVA